MFVTLSYNGGNVIRSHLLAISVWDTYMSGPQHNAISRSVGPDKPLDPSSVPLGGAYLWFYCAKFGWFGQSTSGMPAFRGPGMWGEEPAKTLARIIGEPVYNSWAPWGAMWAWPDGQTRYYNEKEVSG